MEKLARELRWAVRGLRHSPSFTAVTVLTLALGIGANSAVFSLVNGILIKPLPYPGAEEIITYRHAAPGFGLPALAISERDYVNFRAVLGSVQGWGVFMRTNVDLSGDDEPERVGAANVTGGVFDVLSVPPLRGRGLQVADEDPTADAVAVIAESLWKRRYGGDENIVGRMVQIDGVTRQVVGVMPHRFEFPRDDTEVWLPITVEQGAPDADHLYAGLARLRPDWTMDDTLADFQAGISNLAEMFPDIFTPSLMERAQFAPRIEPLRNMYVGDVAASLWVLLGTVGFVLLIACANVANLFLVRAEGGQHDRAVREALGASWGDLARAQLAESAVLALLAGVVGLGIGSLVLRFTMRLAPGALPRMGEVGIDANVLAFTAIATILSAAVFGLLPVLRHGQRAVAPAIGGGARGMTQTRNRHRLRAALVTGQVAIALMLLVGAGLMARSFHGVRGVNPGFDIDGVLTVRISLPDGDYGTPDSVANFFQALLDDLRAAPGVIAAGAASRVPLGQEAPMSYGFQLEDFPPSPGDPATVTPAKIAAPGYFETMGIELIEGRLLERTDHELVTNNVVINRTMAERFWGDDSPLGRRLRHGGVGNWLTIVGVVESVRDAALEQPPDSMVYLPMVDTPGAITDDPRALTLVIRTAGDPLAFVEPLKGIVWSANADIALANVSTLRDIVDASTLRLSFTMTMLGVAAAMALLLGAVGLYGVIAYIVTQRTPEIGVRMALGADKDEVRSMVLRQAMTLAGVGVILGLAGAAGLSRVLESFLYGVRPIDPLTYIGVAALLFGVALAASYWPARRAGRVDPMSAMRNRSI